MKIKVEIGEIVLHGFESAIAAQVEKVVESELANILADNGWQDSVSYQDRNLGIVDGGSINIARVRGDPTSLGWGIARSIYHILDETR